MTLSQPSNTLNLRHHVQRSLPSLAADGTNSFSIKLLGGRETSDWLSDVDVLIVLEQQHAFERTVAVLADWVETLRQVCNVIVVTDTFFLPLLYCPGSFAPVLHLIPFVSRHHYQASLFAAASGTNDDSFRRGLTDPDHASLLCALNDVVRMHLLRKLNPLSQEIDALMSEMERRILSKWIVPRTNIPADLNGIVTALRQV